MFYFGGLKNYRQKLEDVRRNGYEGFREGLAPYQPESEMGKEKGVEKEKVVNGTGGEAVPRSAEVVADGAPSS